MEIGATLVTTPMIKRYLVDFLRLVPGDVLYIKGEECIVEGQYPDGVKIIRIEKVSVGNKNYYIPVPVLMTFGGYLSEVASPSDIENLADERMESVLSYIAMEINRRIEERENENT